MSQFDLSSAADDSRPTVVRHLVIVATTLMAVLLYLDRFCVSFAGDYIREDLGLSQQDMAWFLSAFFWSYALGQVPSGWFSDRYGARIMLVVYILSWSLFTALVGAATGLVLLVGMRLGCGLGQAGAYPTSGSLISKWVPFANRGTASSIVAFGGRVGGFIAPMLTAYLMVLFVPLDVPSTLTPETLLDPGSLVAKLAAEEQESGGSRSAAQPSELSDQSVTPAGQIWSRLPPEAQQLVLRLAPRELTTSAQQTSATDVGALDRAALAAGLNHVLRDPALYTEPAFQKINLPREALSILKRIGRGESTSAAQVERLNRFLLEGTFPAEVGKLYVRGWRPVMYVYGLAGLLVAAVFWFCFRDRPERHPWCNQAECELIAAGRPAGAPSPHGKAGMIPIKALMTSGSMWFCCLMQIGTNIGWVFLVTWLPRYLLEVHSVPILQRGVMTGIPLLIGIAGMLLGGSLTDVLTRRMGLRWGRRHPMMLTRFTAALGYGLCLWFATSADSRLNSPWLFTLAFSLVAFSTDLGNPAVWAFTQDVGGRYVGSILGWGNMWGNLGAAAAPPIYNAVLGTAPSIADWNLMFAVCAGSFILSGLCALGVDASAPIAPPDEL